MARAAPTSGSKFLFILCLLLGSLFLYLDINYKSFDSVKNYYQSFKISSSYLLRKVTVDPFTYIYNVTSKKSYLLTQNKRLQQELDESYLSNFLISRETKIFLNDESIKTFTSKFNIDKIFYPAKIKSFDTDKYFCCDQHRMFIEVIDIKEKSLIGSSVINGSGIVGQIIYDQKYQEVLLLTDTSHSLPIESNEFFCNAKGSGRPGIIYCKYSNLIWPTKIIKGQRFYSSGMGGIYPKGILVGNVREIRSIDGTNIEFDIQLIANPIAENTLGVLENQ